jgi:asparagine synthase (glutamine-hydrolysing)
MFGIWGCWSHKNSFSDNTFFQDQKKYKLANEKCLYFAYRNLQLSFLYPLNSNKELSDFWFCDEKNGLALFFTGYIYNIPELLARYKLQKGEKIPEILFQIHRLEGEKMFNELNGDFVIGILNNRDNTLTIARDHLGVYPMSYTIQHDCICFSPDTLLLCKLFREGQPVDVNYLLNQISARHDWDYEVLPNKKVKRLLPGHKLVFSDKQTHVSKYWEPEKIRLNRKLNHQEIRQEIYKLVIDAVRIRSDKNLQAAVHLSGGLDSSIVAALVRREYHKQSCLNGYSWCKNEVINSNTGNTELERIFAISEHIDVTPVFQDLTVEEYLSYLSEWQFELYILHELKVLELAKQNGDQVIFSGWGGDEFISKNNQGIDSDLIFHMKIRHLIKRFPIKRIKRFIWVLLFDAILPAVYKSPIFSSDNIQKMSRYFNYKKYSTKNIKNDLLRWRSRREVHLNLLYNYHIPARTENLYLFGRKYGIEYKFPLLDKRIIEYMLSIPSEFLYKGRFTRILLRELSDEFLPGDFSWIDQTAEPVLTATDNILRKKAAHRIIPELEKIKQMPEMEIFDFDKIDNDIQAYLDGEPKPDPEVLHLFLGLLKKRYEFVNGYKDNQ